RAVDQAASERGFLLLPQGFGETMLHNRWAELVGYAAEKGIRPIVMLTNGTVLDERNVDRVLALGIDALVISIDGTTPETYGQIRVGGDLRRVEANVLRLIERRGASRTPKICMRIIRMKDTAREIEEFLARWRAVLHPEDEVRINEYSDWSGKVEDLSVDGLREDGNGRGPCRMLWRNLSVHADGKVSACCHDSEDELIVGDLERGDTLQQIWRGEKLQRLRRLHVEGRLDELPICRSCKAWY
ncbi:MAG TPA: SPASM domain-containing protein, partial [Thermoanaerobaculia bacterium]|nr:SPASM domain-containing protein [Thermoanaerobaculia bacterium]